MPAARTDMTPKTVPRAIPATMRFAVCVRRTVGGELETCVDVGVNMVDVEAAVVSGELNRKVEGL